MMTRIPLTALAFALALGLPLAAQQPTAANFKTWDRNGDAKLSQDELPGQLQPFFSKVDRDGDGFITIREHRDFLAKRRPPQAGAQTKVPETIEIQENLDYVGNGNPRQMLDLILPKNRKKDARLPVIVFIHGGGWRSGSKDAGVKRLIPFVETGDYAGATINYRLTGESSWPSQIHDCKAAIRFLRGKAGEFGIDPDKIAVWGTSAGGHLVSMLGTSGGVAELEGELGEFPATSSRVTCVVNFFGPENFLTMVEQSSTINRNRDKKYPEALLLGGPVQDIEAAAKQASPITWVSKDDPPFFTAHGTKDPIVPFEQAGEIHAALEKAGVESHLVPVLGAGHGFQAPEVDRRVGLFLGKHLLGKTADIPDTPVKAQNR